VSVCKTCFLIYSLLADYFEELIKPVEPKKAAQKPPKWVHSEKLLKQKEELPVIHSHKKSISQNSEGLKMLQDDTDKRRRFEMEISLQEQSESKKNYIKKTLSELNIKTATQKNAV